MDALYAGLGVLLACVGLALLLGVVMYGGRLLDHLRGRRDYKLRKEQLKQQPPAPTPFTQPPAAPPPPTTLFTEQSPHPGPSGGPPPVNPYK